MKWAISAAGLVLLIVSAAACESRQTRAAEPVSGTSGAGTGKEIRQEAPLKEGPLPQPGTLDQAPYHQLLKARRSVRHFKAQKLNAVQVGHLLFAGQGVTSPKGFKTAERERIL